MGRNREIRKPEPWDVDVPQSWGATAKQIRLSKNLSLLGLAAKAGVEPDYIAALEHGQKLPELKPILWLASALDVSVDAYIGETKGDDLR